MGGFFRKELKRVDDLKGLKFRIGGMGGQVLAKLGVVPQQIAPGDVYPALERGTIDAAEFVGPYDDEKLGFYKVAKILLLPRLVGGRRDAAPVHQPGEVEQAAQALPGHRAPSLRGRQQLDARQVRLVNAAALRRLVANGAVAEAASRCRSWRRRSRPPRAVYAEIAAKSPDFKKALDSMVAFRGEQLPWWQVAEYSFDTFMISTREA